MGFRQERWSFVFVISCPLVMAFEFFPSWITDLRSRYPNFLRAVDTTSTLSNYTKTIQYPVDPPLHILTRRLRPGSEDRRTQYI